MKPSFLVGGAAADMSLIKAAGVSLNKLDVKDIVRTLPPLRGSSLRHTCIQAVKARSKRVSSKKKQKDWQDSSIQAPLDGGEEAKILNLLRSNDVEDDPFPTPRKDIENKAQEVSKVNLAATPSASQREVVLKACVSTCAAIFAAGVLIQQGTHLAAESGWSVFDSTLLLDYDVETWHLEVILGLVVVVSISRQLLLKAWPEFLDSSDTANKEVLGPLQLSDYVIVAVLPAISEELLFRGALLPICGLDWKGVTVTGLLFGVLHISGGRKNAFAIWASIVGVLYGLACVTTHSVFVPMVAHSANNLIGALIWKSKSLAHRE